MSLLRSTWRDRKRRRMGRNVFSKRKNGSSAVLVERKTRARRKAISSPVAAMLLIAIVIIASVLFYAYSVGLLGSLQKPAQNGSEMLVIEDIVFSGNACQAVSTDCSAYVTLRNVGSINSNIGVIYVDSVPKYGPSAATLIAVGQAQSFTLPNVTRTQHWFKVATLNGSVFSTYGPQNIFIIGLITGTITYQSTTFTTTYTTVIAYTTTLGTSTTQLGTSTTPLGTSTTRLGTSTSRYSPYGTSTTWGGTSTTYGGTSTTYGGSSTTTTLTSSTTTISSTTSSSIGLTAAVSLILVMFLPKLLAPKRTPVKSRYRSCKRNRES